MSTRKEIVSSFYGQYDEDERTTRSRHGQLEYCTTGIRIRIFSKALIYRDIAKSRLERERSVLCRRRKAFD